MKNLPMTAQFAGHPTSLRHEGQEVSHGELVLLFENEPSYHQISTKRLRHGMVQRPPMLSV